MFVFLRIRLLCLCLLFNFWCAVHKLMVPELELRVFDELDEGDEESPRMGAVDDETLQ